MYFPDKEGFLSEEYREVVQEIKNEYKEYFVLIEKINRLIYDMYDNLKIMNNDVIALYLVTSFSKVHKSFQSCYILYSYGFEEEVQIIFRTMLESLFIAVSIKEDNSNFDKLLKNQEIEDSYRTNDLIDRGEIINKEKIKVNSREKTSIWQFSQQGKYSNMYIAYSYLSSYTHIDLRNLEKNYNIENGQVSSIRINPSVDDITFILTEIICLMLNYIELMIDYSKKDYTEDLKKLKEFHQKLKQEK